MFVEKPMPVNNAGDDLTKFMIDRQNYFGYQSEISKIEEDSIQVS